MVTDVAAADLLDALRWDGVADRFGPPAPDVPGATVSVTVGPDDPVPDPSAVEQRASDPSLVVLRLADGIERRHLHPGWWDLADAVIDDHTSDDHTSDDHTSDDHTSDGGTSDELAAIEANVDAHPRAAIALALLLRGTAHRTLHDGLVAESMTYSVLQSGPEFAAWRASRPVRPHPPSTGTVVLVDRVDDTLAITLDRSEVRNALDTQLRDELLDALAIAALDATITRVELRGRGPSYSSGGDLDEFGSFPDPATAHLIRLQRSIGRVIASMRERVVVHLHGACYGSGVEIPAFAGTVLAHPDTRLALPELALGLIPGAGGTVSVTARIGRHRTAALVLSGQSIDAATALDWGLVDAVDPDAAGTA